MSDLMNNNEVYNKFDALDTATRKIVDYLCETSQDLFKLLYYYNDNQLPYTEPNLSDEQIANMLCIDPYDINATVNKQVLFQTDNDEAFQNSIPQIRIEVGDFIAINSYQGYANIDFQIVVPNKQRLFTAPYSSVADRSLAIARELIKALNGKIIPNASFNSPMFLNKSAPDSAGRKTGAFKQRQNSNFSGYWLTFAVLV